ncbi:SHOCT domain-containing protein [Paracoccus sp. SSK6]|uniref:SHOCT domain-containing protein n=1 Tax=Paracoccus sp. SSK6 TaxID=3143131 RepID=UPI00321C3237
MRVTGEDRRDVAEIARRHGFSVEAARAMLSSLVRGHGTQAQFDHPEFGGMGQWSGGMLMVGDMFNTGLKARVEALIRDLAGLAAAAPRHQPADTPAWPSGLGTPSSSGSQGDMRYAVFPEARRLAVMRKGQMFLYDTGDHRIGGVSQQQGGASLQFTSQHGPVSLDSLTRVDLAGPGKPPEGEPAPPAATGTAIPAAIEQLHGLLSRGILTQAEFDAKKADLLSRL